MIADGVYHGYSEARVDAGAWKTARGGRMVRPWRMPSTPRSNDWVSEIATLAQRPGAEALAPIRSASPDGPMAGDVEAVRRAIADSRREAVARSRAD